MESFKSKQFGSSKPSQKVSRPKLESQTRKMYPELSSVLDLQIKQEKLVELQRKNRGTPQG
jgi:hypothetical protein